MDASAAAAAGAVEDSSSSGPVRLSVALVTRGRPESLERTLRSLRAQASQPFEVVVSDDSDPQDVAATRAVALRFDCRYIEGPRRGLYANRNFSALACQGTHVRTMDDDHEFPPAHIEACIRAAGSHPEVIWIIGECLPGQEATEVPWECPAQLGPRGFAVRPVRGGPLWAIADGATIYPRTIFDRGLRFSESFPFGAAYLEWGSRLHWLGYRIRHLDDTFIVHHLDLSARSFMNVRVNAGSRLFAALCHSFIYQPSLRNRLLTLGQVVVIALGRGRVGIGADLDGVRAYRFQRPRSLQDAMRSRAPDAPARSRSR